MARSISIIFECIQSYYHKTFKLAYLLLVIIMLGVIIYFNYSHFSTIDLLTLRTSWLGRFTGYYCLYFVPFALAYFLQAFFFKDLLHFKNKWFWLILFLAPAFFSFRVNFDLHQYFINKLWTGDEQLFWLQCFNWIVRVFIVLFPVYIFWFIKDRKLQPFYGSIKLKNAGSYFTMLVIMIPLISLAATRPDFLNMYPRAQAIDTLTLQHKDLHYLAYELSYGFDFVSIEFFFRGFLIVALIRICGMQCIIPAACFYCCIHLGKPMGEAISSFWGGLLLGIVSYHTRSIWGGLIVHLGIAWLMELAGFLMHTY